MSETKLINVKGKGPVSKGRSGRFEISIWHWKKVIPPQKEYQHLFAEREVDVQRVCIRHSKWSRGTREWKEAVIWCNIDDLRSLSDALEQLTQGESICD